MLEGPVKYEIEGESSEHSIESVSKRLNKAKQNLNKTKEEFERLESEGKSGDPRYLEAYRTAVLVYENKLHLAEKLSNFEKEQDQLYEDLDKMTDANEIKNKEHQIHVNEEIIKYIKDYMGTKTYAYIPRVGSFYRPEFKGTGPETLEEVEDQIKLIRERMAWSN